MEAANPNGTTLLRLGSVMERTGLSRSAVYAQIDFPKAVKLGHRSVAWVSTEVDAWIHSRIAASRTPLAFKPGKAAEKRRRRSVKKAA